MFTKDKKPLKPGSNLRLAPGFFRRTTAQAYDFLLLLAILFLATALLLPFTSGESVSPQQTLIYRIYLSVISFFFYGWFWTHGGQTLGLRAWQLNVLTHDQQPISWQQALVRFSVACVSLSVFGLGFLWVLIDKNHRSWHDYASGTALFFKPKK